MWLERKLNCECLNVTDKNQQVISNLIILRCVCIATDVGGWRLAGVAFYGGGFPLK
jgi:hypothetical protein